MIETREGSILIQPFDQWPYYQNKIGHWIKNDDLENSIQDARFLSRLRLYFAKLKAIKRVPVNQLNFGSPASGNKIIGAEYLPKWFSCPSCQRFEHLDTIKKDWKDLCKNEFPTPPECPYCKSGIKKKVTLEQIRFVMTSPCGDIADVPWDQWVLASHEIEGNDEEEKKGETVLHLVFIPPGTKFSLSSDSKYSDLRNLIVSATLPDGQKKWRSLKGLFNLRQPKETLREFPDSHSKIRLKPVLRSSNSVYFPNILTSLYLPPSEEDLDETTVKNIKKIVDRFNLTDEYEIAKDFMEFYEMPLDPALIKRVIENNFQLSQLLANVSEADYRYQEFNFIISNQKCDEKNLRFEKVSLAEPIEGIELVYRLDKIQLTSVLTSYTRQEPIQPDDYLANEDNDLQDRPRVRKRPIIGKFGKDGYFLPGVENYGEGIFFKLDKAHITSWKQQDEIKTRIRDFQQRARESFQVSIVQKQVSAELVLTHTLSHLLIRELEFYCGYPAASLQERLYVDSKMCGLLIYTIAGAEGSYGGLTSLAKNAQLSHLFKSALFRATDCASDPICWESDGQGVGSLNKASCHSCALIPETSCEEFNSFLDRRFLVDSEFGYFNTVS